MQNLDEFQKAWAGRTFECGDTGTRITIPEEVFFRDFIICGKGFIDVGDGYYARFGGNIKEVKDEAMATQSD